VMTWRNYREWEGERLRAESGDYVRLSHYFIVII
jgi:hypothetical protein